MTEFTLESCKYCSFNQDTLDDPKNCFKHHASEGEIHLCVDWKVTDYHRIQYLRTLVENYEEAPFLPDPWTAMEKISKILFTGIHKAKQKEDVEQ